MTLKNLDRLDSAAEKSVQPYLEKLVALMADNVISAFVYGSAAGPDFDPRSSDINIGIVLKDASLGKLLPCRGLFEWGRRRRIPVPLFLTLSYIDRSIDTFPVEFSDMRDGNVLLYGENILSALRVDNPDILRECEFLIKGKLLTIKHAFLERSCSTRALEELVRSSLRSLLAVFRALLRVKRPSSPASRVETLRALGEEFGVDTSCFAEALDDIKSGGRLKRRPHAEFIASFLRELEKLSEKIDKMGKA